MASAARFEPTTSGVGGPVGITSAIPGSRSASVEGLNATIRTVSVSGATTHAETNSPSTYNLVLTLDQPAESEISVFFKIEAGSANPVSGADFGYGALPYVGQVIFGAGDPDITIPVPITGDLIAEANETFKVTLFDPSSGIVIGQSTLTVTIVDDDNTGEKIGVAVSGALIAEQTFTQNGATGVVDHSFVITLDKPATKQETITWSVVLGTANEFNAAASDFQNGGVPTGTVTFATGETQKTVIVPILADNIPEKNEAFTLRVSTVSSGLKLVPASEATIIIADDDTVAAKTKLMLPSATSLIEGTSSTPNSYAFTLKLDKAATKAETVDWFVKMGPTFSTVDFSDFANGAPLLGTAYFQAGEIEKTVIIPIATDSVLEADEFFTFAVSALSSGLEMGGASSTRVNILDDDTAPPSLADLFSAYPDIAKALAASYQMLLGGVPTQAGFKVLIETAASSNFGAGSGPIFNAENVYINLINNLAQGNPLAKSFFATLSSGATLAEKIQSLYSVIIPLASQKADGIAYLTRPEGLAFYQQVAAERGVAGTDGAAIVAMASLLKIVADENIGIGNALGDLVQAVLNGSHQIPASGLLFTALEVADGTAFDGDDGTVPPPIEFQTQLAGIQPLPVIDL